MKYSLGNQDFNSYPGCLLQEFIICQTILVFTQTFLELYRSLSRHVIAFATDFSEDKGSGNSNDVTLPQATSIKVRQRIGKENRENFGRKFSNKNSKGIGSFFKEGKFSIN